MGKDIKLMSAALLGKVPSMTKFRHKIRKAIQPRQGFQPITRPGAGENFVQLHLDAFPGNTFQQITVFLDGALCLRFKLKIEHTGKAHRAHDTQTVFLIAVRRITHTAHNAPLQILNALKIINDALIGMIRQGIDGKISTAQVFPQIIGKEHFLGVTMVLINAVDPIGGNLDRQATQEYCHSTVLQPCENNPLLLKQFLHLLRQRFRTNIPVLWFFSQQAVPHTAAHQICLKPMGRKTL